MFQRTMFAALLFASSTTPVFAQTPDWSQAKRIDIELSSYAFNPKELHLQHGVAYALHFVNTASKSHNFDAPAFFAASTVAPADQFRVAKGVVELEEQQSADVKLVPNTAGTYDMHCSHFTHSLLGMTGKIVVD